MLIRQDVRGRKSHLLVASINICVLRVSVDISVRKCVLLSAVLPMCPSVHFVPLLIYQSIDKSIDWWVNIDDWGLK